MKQIVAFVEGEGEADAVPRLISRVVGQLNAWDAVQVDNNPFRVGHVANLLANNFQQWHRKLGACLKRRNVGGILLVLDGDLKSYKGEQFCAARIAKQLANAARNDGAGSTYSVAVVFACMEFESWLLASCTSFAGKTLPDGRRIPDRIADLPADLEVAPRDAKGWLNSWIEGGYRPTRDQLALTNWLDFDVVRQKKLRSFNRFESAVGTLVESLRTNQHIATPD